MDYTSKPVHIQIKVLKWCVKRGIEPKHLNELFNILKDTKSIEITEAIERTKKDPPKKKRKRMKSEKSVYKHDYVELRNGTGKSQKLVAEEIPINLITLRNIESQKGRTRPETLAKVNAYYGVE